MTDMEFFPVGGSFAEVFPGSEMIRTGDFLWLSGVSAYNDDMELTGPGDLEAQIHETLQRTRRILGRAGCDFSSIIRLTHYISVPLSKELLISYWKIRREYFGDHLPVSTGVQVVGLTEPEQVFEIDVIAYSPQASK